jgi:hypothetical protein
MNNRSTKDNNFIPIINLIMFPVIWVETLRSFGKRSGLDTFSTNNFGILYLLLELCSKN